MVDTVRTLAALQALLADNTDQDISAQDIRDFLVSVYPAETTFDPNWRTTGGANTIGNGSLVAGYTRLGTGAGSLVVVRYAFTWGSTTSTFDMAPWRLDLPVDALNANAVLAGQILDSGTDNKTAVGNAISASAINIVPEGGNEVTSGVPMSWATGDGFKLGGIYFADA